MTVSIVALRAELLADPLARGYAALVSAGGDSQLAALLNTPIVGTRVGRTAVPADEIMGAIEFSEYIALPAAQRQYLDAVLASAGGRGVDTRSPQIRAGFLAMFAAGSATRPRLVALIDRDGSRAEALFGADVVVSDSDVALALRG